MCHPTAKEFPSARPDDFKGRTTDRIIIALISDGPPFFDRSRMHGGVDDR